MAEDVAEPEEGLDPLSAFDPQWQLPVTGLTFLGQLTDEFRFAGHDYTIKTLKPQEKMTIGLVLQPYRNTLYEELAWHAAHVGMALTSIDGFTNFCPPSTKNLEDFVRGRLAYLTDPKEGWESPLIEYVWARYAKLERVAVEALAQLDSFLQRSQPQSSPWLDSLTDQGPLEEPTSLATQPSASSSSDS